MNIFDSFKRKQIITKEIFHYKILIGLNGHIHPLLLQPQIPSDCENANVTCRFQETILSIFLRGSRCLLFKWFFLRKRIV